MFHDSDSSDKENMGVQMLAVDASRLTQLPSEILTQIFQFASDSPVTMVKLSHVCKEFNLLTTENPYVWQYCPNSDVSKLARQPVCYLDVLEQNLIVFDVSSIGYRCHSLLLKYFSQGPLSFNNPKYKSVYDMFEKKLTCDAEEEYKRLKRKTESRSDICPARSEKYLQDIERIKYSFRKPSIVSKGQFLDQLKFLQTNQKRATRATRVLSWYSDNEAYFETKFNACFVLYIYIWFWFITLGMAQFPTIPYLIDFKQTATVFYPLTLTIVHMALGLTFRTVQCCFKPKSESNIGFYILKWLGLYLIRYLVNSAIQNTVNMVSNDNNYPMNSSIFSSWYVIFLPFLAATILVAGSFYRERIKTGNSSIAFLARYIGFVICSVLTFILLPVYMQGWRGIPLWLVVTPALTQLLHWGLCNMYSLFQASYTKDITLLAASVFQIGLALNLFAYGYFRYYDWKLFGPSTLTPLTLILAIWLRSNQQVK